MCCRLTLLSFSAFRSVHPFLPSPPLPCRYGGMDAVNRLCPVSELSRLTAVGEFELANQGLRGSEGGGGHQTSDAAASMNRRINPLNAALAAPRAPLYPLVGGRDRPEAAEAYRDDEASAAALSPIVRSANRNEYEDEHHREGDTVRDGAHHHRDHRERGRERSRDRRRERLREREREQEDAENQRADSAERGGSVEGTRGAARGRRASSSSSGAENPSETSDAPSTVVVMGWQENTRVSGNFNGEGRW